MTIYMLEKRYKDLDNRWTSDVIDWEGYFTTEQACLDRIDMLEQWGVRYYQYLTRLDSQNLADRASYYLLKGKWDRLSASVDDPGEFMAEPIAPTVQAPLDFEDWKALQESEYSYTDIDRSDYDADV